MVHPMMHIHTIHLHVLYTCTSKWDDLGGGWGARDIDHAWIFFNWWYFTDSISSPGSGFIALIGASSVRSAGGFCGEKSCLTREGGGL